MAGLTKLQLSLYGTPSKTGNLSRTWTTSEDFQLGHTRTQFSETPRTPWGRQRSYGGLGPVTLPSENRPKAEPPFVLQKGHQHFGSGLFPHPRGYPVQQFYAVTQLKKSHVRSNDELVPRPQTCSVGAEKTKAPVPKGSPLSSHISRQAIFPTPDRKDNICQDEEEASSCECQDKTQCVCKKVKPKEETERFPKPVTRPVSRVIHKAMGNFARREEVDFITGLPANSVFFPIGVKEKIQYGRWFSRHDVIRTFNEYYPSETPALRTAQGRRQADWHAAVGYCAR